MSNLQSTVYNIQSCSPVPYVTLGPNKLYDAAVPHTPPPTPAHNLVKNLQFKALDCPQKNNTHTKYHEYRPVVSKV